MADATIDGTGAERASGRDSWVALFGMGVAVGIGAMLSLYGLQSLGSLTEHLRGARLDGPAIPTARVSVDLLPSDLGRPPPTDNSRAAPGIAAIAVPEAASGTSAGPAEQAPSALPTGPVLTVAAVESRFDALNYRLDEIRSRTAAVPRVLLDTVPGDLTEIVEVDHRKRLFFQLVLPLVLTVNEELTADRARLEAVRAGTDTDAGWLAAQWQTYRVEPGDWETLLRRVDAIPPSLALAQAAIESGWGTSRFAREGNALFGQWVWGDAAHGIVPEERQDGATHKIRAFATPLDAVRAYMVNLNRHRAYREFRDIRAGLRRQGAALNGMTLAEGLIRYSEKGREYIEMIRRIIAANRLRPLDSAQLRDARA